MKKLLKKWWFWAIIIVIVIIIKVNQYDGNNAYSNSFYNSATQNEETKKNKVAVVVPDFSGMSTTDIREWCDANKIQCDFSNDYSNSVQKGLFVSQSYVANTTIFQGDTIKIIYSLGRKPTVEEENALKKAYSYATVMHMSKKSVYKQLTSEYGEGFTTSAAQYAIDNLDVDWKENALSKAKTYQTSMNMSRNKIYTQLTSEYGEGFTEAEAQYAVDNLDK